MWRGKDRKRRTSLVDRFYWQESKRASGLQILFTLPKGDFHKYIVKKPETKKKLTIR